MIERICDALVIAGVMANGFIAVGLLIAAAGMVPEGGMMGFDLLRRRRRRRRGKKKEGDGDGFSVIGVVGGCFGWGCGCGCEGLGRDFGVGGSSGCVVEGEEGAGKGKGKGGMEGGEGEGGEAVPLTLMAGDLEMERRWGDGSGRVDEEGEEGEEEGDEDEHEDEILRQWEDTSSPDAGKGDNESVNGDIRTASAVAYETVFSTMNTVTTQDHIEGSHRPSPPSCTRKPSLMPTPPSSPISPSSTPTPTSTPTPSSSSRTTNIGESSSASNASSKTRVEDGEERGDPESKLDCQHSCRRCQSDCCKWKLRYEELKASIDGLLTEQKEVVEGLVGIVMGDQNLASGGLS